MSNTETTVHGLDKKEHFNWAPLDTPGVFMYINKNKINVDRSYQRRAYNEKANSLAREFSWIAVGVVIVSERDNGMYYAVEGQHRVLAAQKRSDVQDLPCLVFRNMTVQQEAAAFSKIDAKRKPISALDKFKANLCAGKDVTHFVHQCLLNENLSISSECKFVGQIKSVASCIRKAEIDKKAFSEVLHVAAELSREAHIPIQKTLLEALWNLYFSLEGGFNQRFLERAQVVGALSLISSAKKAEAFFGKSGSRVWADGMLETLNRGLRNRFERKS